MNLPIPNKHNPNVGAPPPATGAGSPPPKTSTPDGDNVLYRAMLAMTDELQSLSEAQISVAKLSTALYDHMVPHTTDRLKEMQQDLTDYSWLQEHFDEFSAYFQGKGPKPSLGPGMTSGDLSKMKTFYQQHPSLSGCRAAIGNQAQEINAQNTYVQDTKILPQNLDSNVRDLANAEVQTASFFPGELALMKDQYAQPW